MHIAKFTASAAEGLLRRHFEREREDELRAGMRIRKSHNIDIDRSHLNFNLAPDDRHADYIAQRCSEVRCLKRKDVNVMCVCVVQPPPKFLQEHPDRVREFFEKAYDFLNGRYGGFLEENVIRAEVHMDETTPHMHYAWVPVVRDRRRGDFHVSAKQVVNRRDLMSLHGDMSAYMTRAMGIEIDMLTGGTIAPGMTMDQLRSDKGQEAAALAQQVSDLQQICDDLGESRKAALADLTDVKQEIADAHKDLARVRDRLETDRRIAELHSPDQMPPVKRKLGGREVVEVPVGDYATLARCAAAVRKAAQVIRKQNAILDSAEDIRAEAQQILETAKEQARGIALEAEELRATSTLCRIQDEHPELFTQDGQYIRTRPEPERQQTRHHVIR